MRKSVVNIKFYSLIALCSVLFLPLFQSSVSADSSWAEETTPEVKFYPKIVNQYEDEEGNFVTEYSELPKQFTTDASGNIINDKSIQPMNACARQYSYKNLYTLRMQTNGFIANHPGFTRWDKVNGYYFGNTSVSYSVGLSGYGASISVSVAGPGNGTFITANPDRWSRPGIYGDVDKIHQQVTMVDPCGPDSTYTRDIYRSSRTYNRTVYQ
ncbi:hypothetical protein [Exiguobacterium sp. KJ 601]|jgi:hypothetical protein|uniref:hypothetical protein n=1 Tax=Exiguobacterium sp. KJ 601 TaxID=2782569 RepID=UPI0022AED97D|nr:hypothetical protein [Exiguobacterium sp. KJ 601]